jgi:hypothetical protein
VEACAGAGVPHTAGYAATLENPSRQRRIFPVEGEGKCAVQHSVSVSQ